MNGRTSSEPTSLRMIEDLGIEGGPAPELRRMLARVARRPGRWRASMQPLRLSSDEGFDPLPEAA